MKGFILIFILALKFGFVNAQDNPIQYVKVLNFDSLSKYEIFDRALIWCSKSFKDSKSAINVKEREGGIIGGKATQVIIYTIEKNGKNIERGTFRNQYFDWTIEVKQGKLRFSINNIYADMDTENDILITSSEKCPYSNPFIKQTTLEKEWSKIKVVMLNKFDLLSNSMFDEISKKNTDW